MSVLRKSALRRQPALGAWRALPRRTRRLLQRKFAHSLAGAALLLAFGLEQSWAATINVNAACTLIDALTAANTDTATGGCTAGSGADTIVLPANSTHILTGVNHTTYGPTGLPLITSTLTIEGNGSTITRDSGAPGFRILALNKRGNLTLKAATISGGQGAAVRFLYQGNGGGIANFSGTLTLEGCTVTGNTAGRTSNPAAGGGIFSHTEGNDMVVLTNTTISGNTAGFGGGMEVRTYGNSQVMLTHTTVSGNVASSSGGGVLNYTTGSSQVTLTHTMVSGNVAAVGGGVLSNAFDKSQVLLIHGTVSGNRAIQHGGGVSNLTGGSSQVTLRNMTVRDNIAAAGGGGSNFTFGKSQVTFSNSTVSGNIATIIGGGVKSNTFGKSQVTLNNSTVSGNTAATGGGVWSYTSEKSQMILNNSTISGNSASIGGGVYISTAYSGQIALSRTLIAGNIAGSGAEVLHVNLGGFLTANAFDLLGHSGLTGAQAFVGFTPGATDLTATSDGTVPTVLTAILDPTLQLNGGPTQTHNLVSGSPAIDAAGRSCDLNTDQRGFFRPVDGDGDTVAACDIGALEFDSSSDLCTRAVPTTGCTVNGVPHQPCVGTAGNNLIIGTPGNDVLVGLDGHDVLRGQAGDDLLCGGPGDDVLNGGAGEDILDGEEDEDALTGGPGTDICLNGEVSKSCP